MPQYDGEREPRPRNLFTVDPEEGKNGENQRKMPKYSGRTLLTVRIYCPLGVKR